VTVVVDLDDFADARELTASDVVTAFAEGSDVHDVEELERQLGAAPDLDAALIAYLEDADAMPSVAPALPPVRPTRTPARLVVRTDDRSGPGKK
jgi:hypothetical protein